MYKVLCVVLLAALAANAAPHYHHHSHSPFHHRFPPSHHHHDLYSDEFFGENIFDTRRFWAELSQEMMTFDRILQDFYKHFPSSVSREGIEDGMYKITIPLTGFQEKDIKVSAKNGVLMVQAVHKSDGHESEKQYLDIRTLPTNLNLSGGVYTYENEVLKFEFPLLEQPEGEMIPVTQIPTARDDVEEKNGQSREEMETHEVNTNQDADVGVVDQSEDRDKNTELITNEIPYKANQVETITTYPVDVKDEVEFVPVRY